MSGFNAESEKLRGNTTNTQISHHSEKDISYEKNNHHPIFVHHALECLC